MYIYLTQFKGHGSYKALKAHNMRLKNHRHNLQRFARGAILFRASSIISVVIYVLMYYHCVYLKEGHKMEEVEGGF